MHVIQIGTVQHHTRLFPFQLLYLHFQGIALVYELVQFVIQRSPFGNQLGIGDGNHDFAVFQHQRHNALVVHIKSHHHHGIGPAFHLEMPMDNLCRVDVHPLPVPKRLEEQHLSVKAGYRGTALYLILAVARSKEHKQEQKG